MNKEKMRNVFAFIFPVAWFVSVLISLLETYYYQGLLLKHIGIDSIVIYLGYFLLGITLFYFSDNNEDKFLSIAKYVYSIVIVIIGLIFFTFYVMEKMYYPNYVFSTYHIQPKLLATSLALTVLSYLFSSKNVLNKKNFQSKHVLQWFPIVTVMLWILVVNFTDIVSTSYRNIYFIAKNPRATYAEKMEEKIGKQVYDYIIFVKNNTEDNSKILLPPFPAYPWPQTGNIPYMTYFLYPRELFNGLEYDPSYKTDLVDIDYVLLDWGETDAVSGDFSHGWPKFDIKAEKIIFMNKDGSVEIQSGDYIYNEIKDKELWGVIKVEK